jgi:hypothetical protein
MFPLASSIARVTAEVMASPARVLAGCSVKPSFAAVPKTVKLWEVAAVRVRSLAVRVQFPEALIIKLLNVAMPFTALIMVVDLLTQLIKPVVA